VPFDPNTVTPCGKTFAQIDADQGRRVAEANDALSSLRGHGGLWWRYMVSHSTFSLVVGDPMARDGNVVITLAACEAIAGPVSWPNQQLRVEWENDREQDKPWVFTLRDDSVGFKAVAGVFGYKRDVDLLKVT
jgi:hypothetical protein